MKHFGRQLRGIIGRGHHEYRIRLFLHPRKERFEDASVTANRLVNLRRYHHIWAVMSRTELFGNEEVIIALTECILFRFIPPPDIAEFARCTTVRTFRRGDLICARGTTGTEFYIAIAGQVEITVPTYTGSGGEGPGGRSEVVVRSLGKHEFFGELACLDENGTRAANARTSQGCSLLVVPGD